MRNEITKKLTEISTDFERLIKRSKNRLKNPPAGSLNINLKHGQPMYYWYKKGEKKHYLGRNEESMIRRLAQKDFDTKVIKAAEKQKKCIESFIKQYDEDALKNIYKTLSPERKKLIDADIIDDEEYARQWMAVSYEGSRFGNSATEYYTMKGERVRSKSEKIIADTLFTHGIPYRYEYPLYLENGQTWRPDFTILNKRTREEFILEHFGMMDDPEYLANALGKIHVYMENGYFIGDNLIITAESSTKPLSTRDLDMLIEHYFL